MEDQGCGLACRGIAIGPLWRPGDARPCSTKRLQVRDMLRVWAQPCRNRQAAPECRLTRSAVVEASHITISEGDSSLCEAGRHGIRRPVIGDEVSTAVTNGPRSRVRFGPEGAKAAVNGDGIRRVPEDLPRSCVIRKARWIGRLWIWVMPRTSKNSWFSREPPR